MSAAGDLTPRQRQDRASAVRTVARLLGEDPARIPANRRALARRLAGVAPAAHGIGKPAWSNVRYRLDDALDRTLPAGARRRRDLPLAPEWRRLQKRIACQWTRKTLSRLFHFCSGAGIAPSDVDEATLERFAAHLDAVLLKAPSALLRETRRAWNRACGEVAGWPGEPLPVRARPGTYSLPWTAFPASLRADLQGWLDRLGGDDLLSALEDDELDAGPSRPARPATLKHREYQVRQFASALVESGMEPAALRSLADLVAPEAMRRGIQFHLDRHGNKATPALPGLVGALQAIARHWVKASPGELQQTGKWLKKIRKGVPSRGMTKKNRDRLRPFDSPLHVRALLRLPSRLAALADGARPHRAALLVQTAVAVEILLMAPLRIRNLAALDLERHLHWPHRHGKLALIAIDGSEVKNHRALEYPLPRPSTELL